MTYFGRLEKAALAAHAREKISGPDQRSPKFLARDTRGAFDKLGHSKAKSKGSFQHFTSSFRALKLKAFGLPNDLVRGARSAKRA